jgi:hypothetical protein
MKKALRIAVGVFAFYCVAELLSFLVLFLAQKAEPSAFIPPVERGYLADLNDNDLRDYLNGEYDPLLGWHHKPGSSETSKNCLGESWTESFDADGGRSTPEEFNSTLISSYGDSYVKGGDINNDQTWQYQLSKLIGMGVKNYAVGAYDPYQALLKIKRHIAEGNIYPITILGVNEQNIARVLNLYRPFMYRSARAKFSFKPGFYCERDHCEAIGNLLRPDFRTMQQVRDIAHEARQWDYWARNKPAFEYPWSFNLLKLVRLAFGSWTKSEAEPLWNSPEGASAMYHVVADFRESVEKAGSLPVVLFIPTKPKKDVPSSYRNFKAQIAQDFPDLVVLDVADSEFDVKKFKLKPSGACHPSEYGHGIIAKTVYDGLQDVLTEAIAEGVAAPRTK